jgi:EAL domain-containing protein (putative c-di-GMP-specific phosphodiesterase class I)
MAEGVGTNEQLAFLNKCGCDRMQGYLYSHPMPAEMMESLLKAGLAHAIEYPGH